MNVVEPRLRFNSITIKSGKVSTEIQFLGSSPTNDIVIVSVEICPEKIYQELEYCEAYRQTTAEVAVILVFHAIVAFFENSDLVSYTITPISDGEQRTYLLLCVFRRKITSLQS